MYNPVGETLFAGLDYRTVLLLQLITRIPVIAGIAFLCWRLGGKPQESYLWETMGLVVVLGSVGVERALTAVLHGPIIHTEGERDANQNSIRG